MKKDKIKVYILELILIVFLFFTLFASNIFTRNVLTIFMLIYAFIVYFALTKKGIHSIYKKQVTILMLIFSILYIAIYYGTGLYFGFTGAKIKFSWFAMYRFIIPFSVIIVSTEIMRQKFLSQQAVIKIRSKSFDISSLLIFIAMVLVDMVIYTGVYDLTYLENVLEILGFVLFSAISCNLLFNYITTRYGSKGVIVYRLITVLFIYIIPFAPKTYILLTIFLRMLTPYIIYIVLESTYSKTNFAESHRDKKKNIVATTIAMIILVLFIMLVSCQFRFGILVIGSKSMTGTIDMGDAVIFEKYNGQHIQKGQVIIFTYKDIKTVHRVVDVKKVNGEYHYITKGDSNKNADIDYVTSDTILGLVKLKIKYIGRPTLWVRSLFE